MREGVDKMERVLLQDEEKGIHKVEQAIYVVWQDESKNKEQDKKRTENKRKGKCREVQIDVVRIIC